MTIREPIPPLPVPLIRDQVCMLNQALAEA